MKLPQLQTSTYHRDYARAGVHTGGIDRRATLYSTHLKRIVDIVLVIFALPIAVPVLLIFAVIVRLDGGPALFGHVRIGRNGVPFQCWKLRSMVPDASNVLQRHLERDPMARQEWEGAQKLQFDPRVTRIGGFLRRTSIDELPQLWNVLTGEMSLVGPRPVTREELDRYHTHQRAYLACRPGLTGLWQVSGRNGVSYEDRIQMDAHYSRCFCLWFDMQIMLRTVSVVLARTGV